MSTSPYRAYAEQALSDAAAATLDNVRERCLRSAAAWTAMAERAERVEIGRARREPAPLAAAVKPIG